LCLFHYHLPIVCHMLTEAASMQAEMGKRLRGLQDGTDQVVRREQPSNPSAAAAQRNKDLAAARNTATTTAAKRTADDAALARSMQDARNVTDALTNGTPEHTSAEQKLMDSLSPAFAAALAKNSNAQGAMDEINTLRQGTGATV
jgi:hypothetical protein